MTKDNMNKLQLDLGGSHEHIKNLILSDQPPTQDLDISKQYEVGQLALEGYVTLDLQHYEEIGEKIDVIRQYAQDRGRTRPLNMILHAEPGSGKSHFVNCLARKMSEERIGQVVFNMASMRNIDDLVPALDAVRNLKVADKLPLLFLDEFDSNLDNLALLLPLLWDGEITLGDKALKIGKVVIILAGSDPKISKYVKDSKQMKKGKKPKKRYEKLTDLLSRINGGELTIPSLDEVGGNRNRKVDKICLTIALLRHRFGSALINVPWAFLRFVAETKFKHGARSINTLIDLIPSKYEPFDTLSIDDLCLPLNSEEALTSSSLVYHIDTDIGPSEVINKWNTLTKTKALVKCASPDSIWTRGAEFMLNELKQIEQIEPNK